MRIFSLLGVQCGRCSEAWQIEFGHLEHRSVDDWVSACRKVEVAGARCKKGIERLKKSV